MLLALLAPLHSAEDKRQRVGETCLIRICALGSDPYRNGILTADYLVLGAYLLSTLILTDC